jgi:hypothetical protein
MNKHEDIAQPVKVRLSELTSSEAIQVRKNVSKVSGISVIAESKRSLDYACCCRGFRIFDFLTTLLSNGTAMRLLTGQ